MQIQISWFLQKPTDLDLHCLQRRVYPGSAGQGLRGIVFFCQGIQRRKPFNNQGLLPTLTVFACQTGDNEQICSTILFIDSVLQQLINKITIENDVITSGMTKRKYDTSVLVKKSHKDLKLG